MISSVFVDRPLLAFVISIVITLAGLIAIAAIPVAQFPDIVPPQVTGTYPGADAEVVESTVAQPIEEQVNGVDGSINVQNRVALASPLLPPEVNQQGLVIRKKSAALLQVVQLYSPRGTYDSLYLGNYATINLIDTLSRINCAMVTPRLSVG